MPLHTEELSRFFDRHRKDWEHLWNRLVDLEQMSEQTRELNLHRADEIGAILRMLAESQAVLTYQQPEQRKPSPMIFLQPQAIDDAF
jgi:hypothetical protein